MKKLTICRGAMSRPLVKNFDVFDSVALIYNHQDDKTLSYRIENFNTDFCNGYAGGILSEGNYGGVVYDRKDTGKRAIKLFGWGYIGMVQKEADITEPMRVFRSLIPNPNHANRRIITQVLIHADGEQGGYSNGCITGHPSVWADFISKFQLGEIIKIELVRYPSWKAPDYYQGN